MHAEEVELRSEILGAARALFLNGGAEGLSMRKIARQIGITATSIYLYFKDKDDLLRSLGEEEFKNLHEALEESVKRETNPLEKLKQLIKEYVLFATKNPNRYLMMYAGNSGQGPGTREDIEDEEGKGKQKFIALVQRVIEECVNVGAFKKVNAELAAHAFWGFLHGAVMLDLSNKIEPEVNVYKLVSFVSNIFFLSLKAEKPR